MKRFSAFVLFSFAVCFNPACKGPSMNDITANTVLLDVRTPAEFEERNIPGSILIPHDKIADEIASKIPDKNTSLVVFCRSGRRSAIAATTLKQNGYTNIKDLGSIENAAEILKKKISKKKQ
jgi:rhodanese-related sulfurtransferase